MPTNVSPEFSKAQEKYLEAKTDEEKLEALEEMMRFMPQHKGAEALRANIRQRYKKLKQHLEKKQKQKKIKKREGIKKQGIRVVLCGLTNSGKSSLLSCLTNAKPLIADYEFTTKEPIVGALNCQNILFQIIDMPAINHEDFDQGLANTADILLLILTKPKELEEVLPFLERANGKKIVVINKIDLLNEKERRKIEARIKSKRFPCCLISCKTKEGLEELKDKLIENSGVIRVYTKEPRKKPSPEPVILKPGTKIEELAEKILKKAKIREVRVTGPSSKFPNQKVGLKHQLKDKDIVEFYTE